MLREQGFLTWFEDLKFPQLPLPHYNPKSRCYHPTASPVYLALDGLVSSSSSGDSNKEGERFHFADFLSNILISS